MPGRHHRLHVPRPRQATGGLHHVQRLRQEAERLAMPRPVPKSTETQQAFIDRFMGDPNMKADYPNVKQRLAIAENQWGRITSKRHAKKTLRTRASATVQTVGNNIHGV